MKITVACLIAVTTCLCVFLLEGAAMLRDVDRAVPQETARLNGTLAKFDASVDGLPATITDVHRTVLIAGGAISNIEKGTRLWQNKENDLADQTLQVEINLNAELESLRTLTGSLSDLSKEQGQSLSGLEQTASLSLTKIATLSDSLQPTLSTFQKTNEQLLAISQDMHTETDILVAQTRKAVAPKNKAMALLEASGGGATTVLELIYYMTHLKN